jgi:hypothetical protein
MQRFKSWDEIEPTATEAEWKLKEAVEAGDVCVLGTGDLPPEPDDWSNIDPVLCIRGTVMRYFIDMHNQSDVHLCGAIISGPLDLSRTTIHCEFRAESCRFHDPVNLSRSEFQMTVSLIGSYCRRLNAEKSIFLEDLVLQETTIQSPGTIVLNLRGAKVGGHVSLYKGKFFGSVDMLGAKIEGQLILSAATFFDLPNDDYARPTIILQSARIDDALILEEKTLITGGISLVAAQVGTLVDDPDCMPALGAQANGFVYQRIIGETSAHKRINWLSKFEGGGSNKKSNFAFRPQPYKQLAKVLHDMGHEADAREVLYVLEKKLGAERRKALRQEIERLRNTSPALGRHIVKHLLLGADHAIDWLQRVTVGYGRKPFRSIGVLAGLILTFWMLTLAAWHTGGFAPNSSIVLTSPDWATYDTRNAGPTPRNPADHWSEATIPGRDWESFSAIAYAADIVVPIIDFGQTEAWAPSTTRGPAGVILWWARWVFTLAGWIVTALGAAALTGIIRRE